MWHPGVDVTERRERLIARARGRVLDVSFAGADARDYRNVGEVVPVNASQLATAQLDAHSFDTIVLTLVLCSVSDVYSTLLRLGELLADGGQLLVLEHVRSTGLRGRIQDAAAPMWRRVGGGCRANRDAIDELRRGGFAVTDCDRFTITGATPLVRSAVSAVAIRRVRQQQGVAK